MGTRQRVIRLGMLTLLALGVLITIFYSAFWYYQYAHPFGSGHYDGDREYMAQQLEEAREFVPAPNRLLTIEGAELIERKYLPSSNGVTEKESLRVRRRPEFLANYYERRWGSITGMKSWTLGEGGYYDVTAIHKTQKLLLQASIIPDHAHSGYTIVNASVRRPPNRYEKSSFQLPGHLPRPPQGALESVTGGGGSDTKLGRVFQYVIPRKLTSVLEYYEQEFERDGWEQMGRQKIPGRKGGVSMVFRKDSYGVTLQGSAIKLRGKEKSVVALVPF